MIAIPLCTNGGDRTSNHYDCQNFKLVFARVPIHIKQIFMGLPVVSTGVNGVPVTQKIYQEN